MKDVCSQYMKASQHSVKAYKKMLIKMAETRTSLAVQWLRLRTLNAGSTDLIPGQGTIPHATWRGQRIKKAKD